MAPTKAQIATRTPQSQIIGVGKTISLSFKHYGCQHIRSILSSNTQNREKILRAYELAVRISLARSEKVYQPYSQSRNKRKNKTATDIKINKKKNRGKNNNNSSSTIFQDEYYSTDDDNESYKETFQKAQKINTKLQTLKCRDCGAFDPALYCCLHCSFVGCLDHLKFHHTNFDSKDNHVLAVDLVLGSEGVLYCTGCNEYVYDATFEEIKIEKIRQHVSLGLEGLPQGSVVQSGSLQLGTITRYNTPSSESLEEEEKTLIDEQVNGDSNSTEFQIDTYMKETGPGYSIVREKALLPAYQATSALRGFYNMGSTCFMSVIFQALLHNPLVRNFYLAGGHERGVNCGRNTNGSTTNDGSTEASTIDLTSNDKGQFLDVKNNGISSSFSSSANTPNYTSNDEKSPQPMSDKPGQGKVILESNASINCLSCSLDEVFTEFFTSSSVAGFGPTELLTTAWQVKRSLGGSSQQDAHEFLQIILNELHSNHYDSPVFLKGCQTAFRDIGMTTDQQTATNSKSIPRSFRNLEEVNIQNCGCVSHRTFCGELESVLSCQGCGRVSSIVVDPMMDLSLDVRETGVKRRNKNVQQSNLNSGANTPSASSTNVAGSISSSTTGLFNNTGKRKAVSGKNLPGTYSNGSSRYSSPSIMQDMTMSPLDSFANSTNANGTDSPSSFPPSSSSSTSSQDTLTEDRIPVTLEECLDRFTQGETLHDATSFCETCQKQQPIAKKMSIKRLPSVLTIQLKRFSHTSSKIESHVDFPLVLDMNKYTSCYFKEMENSQQEEEDAAEETESEEYMHDQQQHQIPQTIQNGEVLYDLFGVVCHHGTLNTGHYTCMMKTSSGRWFHFDDAVVTTISANKVKQKNAYLLFYIVKQVPSVV